ncbi:hypothetical protein LTR67_009350 [Exophiala xenobiotica]
MNSSRQQAFLRLRPPCVELSSTALKFKANQVSAKAVLLAIEPVHQALQSLADETLLDEKLAEYAFFPLTHIFNQSKRLSSPILELAVKCVHILVSRGWRDKLLPEMAKQLLILMGLLVSPSPNQQSESASDELKVASFECISVLVTQSVRLGTNVLEGVGEKSIVDQLVYQLLESLTETRSDNVQISAAGALLELNNAITDRPLLASLLPRTVSTLVKVLRPSTEARRTRKVLVAYLDLLSVVLDKVLADSVALCSSIETNGTKRPTNDHAIILDKAWLDATTPQIDIALVQVVKLRTHEGPDVTKALLNLCLMIIEDCSQTLSPSLTLMIETLVVLCRSSNSSEAKAALRHLMISRPEISEILRAKFYDWSQALPRIMQGNEDRPKQHMLGQIATSFVALTDDVIVSDEFSTKIAAVLVDGVTAAIAPTMTQNKLINEAPQINTTDLVQQSKQTDCNFVAVLLSHQSQRASTEEIKRLIDSLKTHPSAQAITRSLVDQTHGPDTYRRLSATWLALNFLQNRDGDVLDMDDMFADNSSDLSLSQPFLVSDLYASTLPSLLDYSDFDDEDKPSWQLVALSLESLVLQATQLGQSYRPELMETLFPILTLLGSRNAVLQQHAMTALNLLAKACDYHSAALLLIDNVDYLINAIALRLNTFDVSRNGLQVLTMMIRLCGVKLLPYLDDLIGSMFGALDNFHGYPSLVEQLFEILRMIVEESTKVPEVLAIELGPTTDRYSNKGLAASTVEDILHDVRVRKERKSKTDEQHEQITSAPHRPWSSTVDNPRAPSEVEEGEDEDEQADLEANPPSSADKTKEAVLSKPHQLLLKIAQSGVPHMSSPSAKVRHTILALLQELCPLLASNENSFLPLVNEIWPSIVARVLMGKDDSSSELPYNVQSAADTISVICRAAGDFMSSRVEDIFSDLEALFRKFYKAVLPSEKHRVPPTGVDATGTSLTTSDEKKPNLLGKYEARDHPGRALSLLEPTRTTDAQTLNSLVGLILSILDNVRVTEDNIDRVFDMLGPIAAIPGNERVTRALMKHNEDAMWLMAQHMND